MKTDFLTQYLALDTFEYKDGELYWKVDAGNGRIKAGTKAGCVAKLGYKQVTFRNTQFFVHRIIFLMHHGYLPPVLDHADGNPSNNKIENLREATTSQNGLNEKRFKNNKSGVKGVSWNKKTQKWTATTSLNKKYVYLGRYESLEEARIVLENFRNKHHGEFARHK